MNRISRRRFAAGLGAGLLAAPFAGKLSSLRADGSRTAQRLVIFFSPNGTIHQHWRPQGSGTSFSFPAGSILEPLTAHKSDLIVCDGIDFHGVDNHVPGMSAMLTGGGDASTPTGGKSLDQYVAENIGEGSRYRSLEFGVYTSPWGSDNQTRMSYSAAGVHVEPNDDPLNPYNRLFGDIPTTPGEVDTKKKRRDSINKLVTEEITDLRGRVPSVEQAKLDDHLKGLKQLLGGGALEGANCSTPPAAPTGLSKTNPADVPAMGKAQMDMLVLALQCGMTRVASLQWSHTTSPMSLPWLGISDVDHHSLSHSGDGDTAGVDRFVKAETWFVEQFAEQWLDIKQLAYKAKDAAIYPEFSEGVKEDMFNETRSFFRHVMTEGSGSLSELLTAKYSMMDDSLATFYGLPAPGGTADVNGSKQVDVSGANRGGLLTLGAVLATHARPSESSPIHRGKFVRERLLCQPLSLPPPGLEIVPPGLDPTKSTRERFSAHAKDPLCKSCHTLMDPLGFGFEHFDGIGRYRESEGSVPIDVSGEVTNTQNTDGTFDGTTELAATLASSPDVEACFALQWLRFGFGVEDQAELSCTAGQLTKELTGDKLTIPALIRAITQAPRFTRRLAEGSAAPLDPPGGGGAGGAGGSSGSGPGATTSSSTSASSGGPPDPPTSELGVREDVYTTWATGGCERAYVTNHGSATVAWAVTLMPPATVSSFYGTQTPQPVASGVRFVGADDNAMLAPGATVEFGFCWGS